MNSKTETKIQRIIYRKTDHTVTLIDSMMKDSFHRFLGTSECSEERRQFSDTKIVATKDNKN